MYRSTRLAVMAVGLLSLFGILSGSAGAITWENSGDTGFAATASAPTFGTTGLALSCASVQLAGTAPAITTTATYTINATGSYTGCTFGGSAMNIECGYKFTGTSQSGATTTVTGQTDVTCGVYISNSKLCHLAGSGPATYENPAGSATGSLALSTATLLVTLATCPFGNNELMDFTPHVFRINGGTGGPRITRTA